MIRISALLAAMVALAQIVSAQDKWQLVKNADGIKVYTRRLGSEKFKEVRANFEVNGTEAQLISVLQDIPHQKDWSYGTKSAFLIKKKSPDTLIYYSEIALPWPLSNRDLVIELSFKRDTMNHILHIQAKSIPGILAPKPKLVRVPFSLAVWEVKVQPGKLSIQYTLSTDPGGALPAWLINMAATTGPYNSFQQLKTLLKKENK